MITGGETAVIAVLVAILAVFWMLLVYAIWFRLS